ncbi:MAG TPA: LacI family DNA-binding transcriptional regulator [Caldilineaceae bacterium]|nr:LacI family DNA-binding transcriptional regulator [Caldilineaceae bacterium]
MTTLTEIGSTEYLTTGHREPTMRDVAMRAGVSIKTVSRIINQEPGVSEKLSQRVQQAIRELDYRHNATASNLRRADQRTATIGLLLDDVANPFSSALHRAVEEVARQHNTLVFALSSVDDPKREEEIIYALATRRVDGLITVPVSRDGGGLRYLQRQGQPIVFVDRLATFYEADTVVVDNRSGAAQAVQHLVRHGHSRIAFLGDVSTIWTAAERYLGYVEGLAIEGIRLNPSFVCQGLCGIEAAEQAVLDLFAPERPPTALFTAQNLITIGAIRALQKTALQHKVALIGFDDFLLADLLEPPVSVIAQDPMLLGKSAAELLFARLQGDRQPSQQIVIPTQLIARGSGEIPSA